MVATFATFFLVERFGRKYLVVWGSVIVCLTFFINSILFTAVPNLEDNLPVSYFILIFIFVFQAAYAMTWGPMGWLIPGEVMPLNVRGKGMALAASSNMFFNILIGDYGVNWLSSDDVLGTVGTWWFLFGLNCLWTLPFVIFMLPETKSLTLEEMHNAFDYTFGGDATRDLGTMMQYICKNAGQAWDILRCRKADIYAGFDKHWRMEFIASTRPTGGKGSDSEDGSFRRQGGSRRTSVEMTKKQSVGKLI